MTWLVLIVLVLIIFWMLDKGSRTHKKAVLRNRQRISGEKITFTELANKRHNIRTAHNMIKLGLVRSNSIDDDRISYLYSGGDHLESHRLHLLAHRYGLIPGSMNYVGD